MAHCVIPCPAPKKKFSIGKAFKIIVVAVILTAIIIAWAILLEEGIRKGLNFPENSIAGGFVVAVVLTVLGLAVLLAMRVNIEEVMGMDI